MKMERTSVPGVYLRGRKYILTYRDPDGIQRKESFPTLKEAKVAKARRSTQMYEGTYQPESHKTLHVYADNWLKTYDGIREVTRDDYKVGIRYAKEFFSPKVKLTAITPRAIAEYVAWLKQEKNLAPGSVRKRLAPLRCMYGTAMEHGIVRMNPCMGVRMPKATAEPHDRDHEDEELRIFTREQLDVIIKTSKQPLLLELLACTGLRISEALALEWRHLELNGSDPHVKVRRGIVKGTLGPPKSKAGRRVVPLPVNLVRALRKAKNAQESTVPTGVRSALSRSSSSLVESEAEEDGSTGRTDSGLSRDGDIRGDAEANGGSSALRNLVFPSKVASYLDPNSLRRDVLKPATEEAGCGWAGFHTFRHTFASMHIARGTNLVALSRVMGHHSPSFTLRVYGHLIEGEEAPALDLERVHPILGNMEETSGQSLESRFGVSLYSDEIGSALPKPSQDTPQHHGQ